jgi:hypothetical protein
MKVEVEGKRETETLCEDVPKIVKSVIKRVSEEERIENIKKEFKVGLKRELTKEELEVYLFRFKNEDENYWSYLKKLKDKDKLLKKESNDDTLSSQIGKIDNN